MAVELTKDQRRVLQLVFEEHRTQGAWPVFGTLDRRLARSKEFPDLGHVVRELPAGLLLPLWSGVVAPRADSDMRLTALGLRWIAKRELKFEPTPGEGNGECAVSGPQLMRAFRLSAERRRDVERLGHLLGIEQWGWTTWSTGSSVNWRFGVGRGVRRFATVHSIEEYAAKKNESSRKSGVQPLLMLRDDREKEVPAERYSRAYVDKATTDNVMHAAEVVGLSTDRLGVLLTELNDNFSRSNAYACHVLLRALLDHIPPMFGYQSFGEVANNFPWGRTDKQYMRRLADFRLQADDALHRQISTQDAHLTIEDLPPSVWFRRLLAGCARSTSRTGDLTSRSDSGTDGAVMRT
jgi:hypothetical protein